MSLFIKRHFVIVTGMPGDKGLTGPSGKDGEPGPTGNQGPKGDHGKDGAAGKSYRNIIQLLYNGSDYKKSWFRFTLHPYTLSF